MSTAGKRKFADPVAAAAMDALSSSDDDEPIMKNNELSAMDALLTSSDDDAPILKKDKPAAVDALLSSSDEDVSLIAKKKKPNELASPKKTTEEEGGGTYDVRRRLKPFFDVEDEVYAAWWPTKKNKRENLNCSWHPGVIKSYREKQTDSPYGPTRFYDIMYDDGAYLKGVEDHYVFPKLDYQLTMKNDGISSWVGVKNVCDCDVDDKWARIVGWYVATIDGKERPFRLLKDAMDTYDEWVVKQKKAKGKNLKRSDINRPEKYSNDFFENSSSDGDTEEDGANSKSRRNSFGNDCQNGMNFQSLERNDGIPPPPPTVQCEEPTPENELNRDESASPRKQQKIPVSAYKGVSYSKLDRKYLAQVDNDGKLHCLGYYKFEADAGLAVDKASMLGTCEHSNFSNRKEYEDAIRMKMEFCGQPVDVVESYDAVVRKVEAYLSKIFAAKSRFADAELGNSKMKVNEDSDGDKNGHSDGEVSTKSDSQNSNKSRQNVNNGKAPTRIRPKTKKSLHGGVSPMHNSKDTEPIATEPNDNGISKMASVTEPKVRRKHSKFTGVTYNNRSKRYLSQIGHGRKTHFLGYYKLECDAAIAYDEAAKLLRGADTSKVNFASGGKDYADSRTRELEETDFRSTETLMEIAAKIQKYLLKIPCPEITAINDAMTEKWAHHLPVETGREYLDLYKENISDVLGSANLHKKLDTTTPSIVSDKQDGIHANDTEIESVQGKKPDSFFKPIAEGKVGGSSRKATGMNSPNRSPKQQIHSAPENDSNDDASLFSDSDGHSAEESNTQEVNALPDTNSTSMQHASDVSVGHSNGNFKELPDQIKKLPIGCPVLWNFDAVTNSFRRGTVTSVPIHGTNNETAYEVMPTESRRSIVISAKLLVYGLNCPVYFSNRSGSHQLEGKVLFYKTPSWPANNSEGKSFSYTVLTVNEGNQFQVMDVPSEHVKFREVIDAEVPVHTNDENAASADRGSVAIQGEVTSQSKKPTTSGLPPAEENGSPMSSRKFFSSNSTITSVDSAPASSQRASIDGTSGRGCIVSVEFYIPDWLIHDSASKQRLISHLLRVDTRISDHHRLHRIGRSTNCSLRIVESGDFHVLIQTRPGKYATEDIRKAEEKLERALLEHIHHDGSSGRLFYDLARSCEFLHPKGNAQSTSVMQRNPFTPNNEMGWMNIVELPSIRMAGNQKHYHGHYLLAKKVLGHIKHETRCEIKICGDEFNVPTNCCAPYIWVMGDQPGMVDRAVDILQEAIQNHMSKCGCAFQP